MKTLIEELGHGLIFLGAIILGVYFLFPVMAVVVMAPMVFWVIISGL